MQPTVTPFHHAATGTWSYVVADPATRVAAIIDPVLDYDWKSARTGTQAVDQLIAHCREQGLTVRWILETHAHADHLSSAQYLKQQLGGEVAIGAGITSVQRTFKTLFGLGPEFVPDGSQFDRLLEDDATLPLGRSSIHVIPTPGHTNDSVSYLIGDAVFIGDTLFMPDSGSARCDFPGGDAAQLYRSVQRLFSLPAGTRVFVCHDYSPGGRAAVCETTHRRAATRQHAHPRRRRRSGLRPDAHRARRHARRAEPDHSVGAGQHPGRSPAAARGRRRPLPASAARRLRQAATLTSIRTPILRGTP